MLKETNYSPHLVSSATIHSFTFSYDRNETSRLFSIPMNMPLRKSSLGHKTVVISNNSSPSVALVLLALSCPLSLDLDLKSFLKFQLLYPTKVAKHHYSVRIMTFVVWGWQPGEPLSIGSNDFVRFRRFLLIRVSPISSSTIHPTRIGRKSNS